MRPLLDTTNVYRKPFFLTHFFPGKVLSDCSLMQNTCVVIWTQQWRVSGQAQTEVTGKKSIDANLAQFGKGLSKVKR